MKHIHMYIKKKQSEELQLRWKSHLKLRSVYLFQHIQNTVNDTE